MLFAIEYEDENCYFKNLPARAIDVDAVNRQIPYRAFAGSLSSKKITYLDRALFKRPRRLQRHLQRMRPFV